jgi:hypothetical protein
MMRRLRGIAWLVAASFSLLLGMADPAAACSCKLRDVTARFHDATIVFTGEIESVSRDDLVPDRPFEDVTFIVRKGWKGVIAGQRLRFRTMVACCVCGIGVKNMSLGTPWSHLHDPSALPQRLRTWLVFADGPAPYGLHECSGSAPVDQAGGDLRWLRQRARGR